MKRVLFLAALVACGDTTQTVVSQLYLTRPRDMAFACYGQMRFSSGQPAAADQNIDFSPMPLLACDDRALLDPRVAPGQDDLSGAGGAKVAEPSYYGFVLEPTISSVSLWSWAAKAPTSFTGADVVPIDSDPLTPGVNGITVGDDPVAITADTAGCKIVTANEGSCDMSVVDVASAVSLVPPARVDRLVVKNASGVELRGKPFAMVGEPPGGKVGYACASTASGIAYVAYPNCHLVAAVDLSSGTVVAGIALDALGAPTITDGNVTCPNECGGDPITIGTRPVALDLNYDPRTQQSVLAIGSDNSDVVSMIALDPVTHLPASTHPVKLDDPSHTLGVTAVSVTPTIGMGGDTGVIDDTAPHQHQFVYAVASDRSVRVADIFPAVPVECDAEVDPRYLATEKNIDKLSCMPVGDPSTPPRRPGAHSPGIELVGDSVPTSVATYHVDSYDADTRIPGPTKLIGYFGVIAAENGHLFVFNIDDDSQADFVNPPSDPNDPLGTQVPLDIAHQLRDGLPDRGALAVSTDGSGTPVCDDPGPDPDGGANAAGARSPNAPVRNVPALYVAGAKVGELPYIRSLLCTGPDDTRAVSELEFAAPLDVRLQEFPDLRGLLGDEQWTLTYQGTLSLDSGAPPAVDGPIIRSGELAIDNVNQMRLDDPTRPFCDAGVEPYDIVQLRGCNPTNGSNDCPIGYTCYVHPQSQVQDLGACMLADESDRLAGACKAFLTSLRRYTVGKSASGELTLIPRKHILRTTPVDGCTSDDQCQQLANYAAQNSSASNPIDHTIVDTHKWSCQVDAARAPELDPLGAPLKRCIGTCTQDSDCTVGSVCDPGSGFCMEGVVPPQACVNAPQRFELRASEAFTVIGSRSGYVHPIIADASGNCTKDPAASPLEIGRIPLRAPACDPTADPLTGALPGGGFEADPCEETVMHTEQVANFSPTTCAGTTPPLMLVTRQASAIKFRSRGMTLRMVDPTYPGDQTCIGDRMGGLGNVPLAAENYQIAFRQVSGFAPLVLGVLPSLPVKIVKQPRGPGDALRDVGFGDPVWVIDEGDFISTSITEPSTLGKVFRVETQALQVVNTLQ